MAVIWSSGRRISVSDVVKTFARRKKPVAYSTIKTILTNLAAKGHLEKRAAGRVNFFKAVQSRADFERETVDGVADSLLRDYRDLLLSHLADELARDSKSIAEFQRLVAARRKRSRSA